MTALLGTAVPAPHASDHVLAVSSDVDVLALARAWFADARWVREPVDGDLAARPQPRGGARMRGMVHVPAEAIPGEMLLAPRVTLRGPYPLTAAQTQALDLPSRRSSAYAIHVEGRARRAAPTGDVDPHDDLVRAFPGGRPVGDELLVARWLVAAARHARGAVLVDGGGTPVVPDPRTAVDLSLFSPNALEAERALALARTILVQAQLVTSTATLDGPQEYSLRAETPYDGTVTVRFHRTQMLPLVLNTVPWRDSGPFAYRVGWGPGTEGDLGLEQSSQLYSIARTRMAPVVNRLTLALQTAIGGIVVDADGFMRDASYLA
ncbi:hypothetical protein [Sanguibacter antarcticus]|uniref:Uncharacterized protein n=1 Tax=Sanguibacter antarcticus TaxID=372484 RepID=A0A2A9E9Q8_9MICO|nr:hypothetical protein [Sanguibacter antarcticus]PFG35015.1 hypothetical protein ATL42_2947 [Sanguibacter antarcticus]